MPDRLEGRDHEIWQRYVAGWTQARLAAEYDVSQQRISQVLAEVREGISDDGRVDAAVLAQERANALLAAVWPAAMGGDPRSVGAALRVLERLAKALGTDAVEPLKVSLEQRLDVEGGVIVDALRAAFAALELSPEREAWAAWAASAALYRASGQEPPDPPPPAPAAAPVDAEDGGQAKREAQFRKMMAADGVDADELLADDDDQEDDDDGDV